LTSYCDAVVVGAGAAGLAAADTLTEIGGLSVAVVEAAKRKGGRCWSDLDTFGIPYDVGAHWLHYAGHGQLLRYGQQNGFDLYPDPKSLRLCGHDNKTVYDSASLNRLLSDCEKRIERRLAQSQEDISVAEAIGLDSDSFQRKTVEFIWGPWIMGKTLEELSARDGQSLHDDDDWFCRQGLGTLLAHRFSQVSVSLNTAVTEIDWRSRHIKVKTTRGDITARAVIVTVSTGVLGSGGIRFTPSLPIEKMESFDAISMGHYEHIALQFCDYSFIDNCIDRYVLKIDPVSDTYFGALLNISGNGLTFCDVGGQYAIDLSQYDQRDAIALAIEQLSAIFGSDIEKLVIRGDVTSWATNKNTKGSYASAKAGGFRYRETLRDTVADKIFFAGEACHQSMWASVGGAIASGVHTANKSAEVLGK